MMTDEEIAVLASHGAHTKLCNQSREANRLREMLGHVEDALAFVSDENNRLRDLLMRMLWVDANGSIPPALRQDAEAALGK